MSKIKSTASEVQLKARRTSLGKKTNDELITIILRKDKSERTMNSKIQELTSLLKEADELNEEKASRISNFEIDMNDMAEVVKVKQEQIDNLLSEKNNLKYESDKYCKEVIRLRNICNFRRKVIFSCFGIITILIILLIL